VSDAIVCLGCGYPLELEAGEEGFVCACPPPLSPPSSRARGPYRALSDETPCPRCAGPVAERELHDVVALECAHCLGIFLGADIVDKITSDDGREVRLAFPRRPRASEPTEVRYIPCIVCKRQMNRTVFARVSGVIVDVCKDHGVWFDAGEINAIIAFVEEGGMERASKRIAADKAAESKRLAAERERNHRTEVESHYRRMGQAAPLDPELRRLFDWW